MFRKDLIDILQEKPISLHELALLLDSRPRDLEDDLQHLFRSLRNDPLCPVIVLANCRKCGFLFDDTIADSWEMTLYDSGRRDDTRLSST